MCHLVSRHIINRYIFIYVQQHFINLCSLDAGDDNAEHGEEDDGAVTGVDDGLEKGEVEENADVERDVEEGDDDEEGDEDGEDGEDARKVDEDTRESTLAHFYSLCNCD